MKLVKHSGPRWDAMGRRGQAGAEVTADRRKIIILKGTSQKVTCFSARKAACDRSAETPSI